MKKALLVIAVVLMCLTACNKLAEPLPAKFWPLAPGNTWSTNEGYMWDVEGTTGNDTTETTFEVEPYEHREDGKPVWPVVAKTDSAGTMVLSRTYYYVSEDSVYLYEDKEDVTPHAVEPNELQVGDEWDGMLALPISIGIQNFSTNFDAHFTVLETDTVEVPAGTFNCLKIQIDLTDYGVDSAAFQWRAEGIGIVKIITDFNFVYSLPPLTLNVDIEGTMEMEDKSF